MKKKELMTLNPLEFTPYLKQIARQDKPVPSDHWGTDKKYKYGRYLRVKEEKGYLIISVFLAQFVRAGAKYPVYVVYIDKKLMILSHLRQIPENGGSPCCGILTGQDICMIQEHTSAGEMKNWSADIWGRKQVIMKIWVTIRKGYESGSWLPAIKK